MLEDSQLRSPWAPNFTNVDLHDPANFGDGPPYEAFEVLRNNAPVAFHPEVPRRHGETKVLDSGASRSIVMCNSFLKTRKHFLLGWAALLGPT